MTDKEIEALWLRVTGFNADDERADIAGFARALLAAGASEGQSFDEWKKGWWFVDCPDEPNAESAAREAWNARDAEIASLRERIAGMEKDAVRYRWLARKVSAHGVIDGWAFGFPSHLTLPAPPSAMRDPEKALGETIDAAIEKEPK